MTEGLLWKAVEATGSEPGLDNLSSDGTVPEMTSFRALAGVDYRCPRMKCPGSAHLSVVFWDNQGQRPRLVGGVKVRPESVHLGPAYRQLAGSRLLGFVTVLLKHNRARIKPKAIVDR